MSKKISLVDFLDEEINSTESFIMSTRDKSYLSACKTKRHLEAIKKDFCDKQKGYCEMEKYLNLSNIKISDSFIKFIKEVAKYYAAMPLTETESSIHAPILPTRKYITNEEIIDFLNDIYNSELHTDGIIRFNEGNIKIFKNSFLHKKLSSKCVPYHNYHELYSILIVNKFFNVNDIIISCSKATELLPEIEFKKYDNIINIMVYYMKYKALEKVKEEYNQIDAKNFYLLALDNLIMEARQILIMLNSKNWNELSKYQQSCILNFIDNALGATIAHIDSFSLIDIIILMERENNIFDIDKFNLNEDNIIKTAKEIQYTYKSR